MGWFSDIFGLEEEVAAPTTDEGLSPRDLDKVDFHIKRFELALDQCTKRDKQDELRKNLNYWYQVRDLKAAKEAIN